jgi:small subunit ribosomal protein S21
MITVKVRDGESFESAFRRFKRQCEQSQVLSDVKKHEFFEKPSERRKNRKSLRKRGNEYPHTRATGVR